MKKGLFITIDGPDGCGKSTNAVMLCEYIKRKGYKVVHTYEPGGTAIGEKIRKILLAPENIISPEAELLLYEASRAQLVKEIIIPAVKKNRVVVCERFYDATTAYQGYGRGLDIEMIKSLNKTASCGVVPDLTIILDIDAEKGLKKAVSVSKDFKKGVADRLEKESMGFHKKVRAGFLKLAKEEPLRIKVVKVSDTIESTQKAVRKEVDRIL